LLSYRAAIFSSFNATKLTANIIATKGTGERLIIIGVSLDKGSPESGSNPFKVYFKRIEKFVLYILSATAVLALLSILTDTILPSLLSAFGLMVGLLIYQFSHENCGSGGDKKIAATISAASRCWTQLDDEDTEITLLIMDAGTIGQMGCMNYLNQLDDRLTDRDVTVFGIEKNDLKPFAAKGITCFDVDADISTVTPTDMSNALEVLIWDQLKDLDDAV